MSFWTQTRPDRVVALVGNPALGSRTSVVARTMAEEIARLAPPLLYHAGSYASVAPIPSRSRRIRGVPS